MNKFDLIPQKYFIITFAAVLVVAFGIMGYKLMLDSSPKPSSPYQQEIGQINQVSQSEDLDSIENDLQQTDIESMDKELQMIENELETGQ